MRQDFAHSQEAAETLAIDTMTWIAGDQDMLANFMGSTGVGMDDLKLRLKDGEFLGAVLDFLMMDDDWVVAFCKSRNLPYDAPSKARAALPGGQQVHWT